MMVLMELEAKSMRHKGLMVAVEDRRWMTVAGGGRGGSRELVREKSNAVGGGREL